MADAITVRSYADESPDPEKDSFVCPHCGIHAQQFFAGDLGLGHDWVGRRCSLCNGANLWKRSADAWTIVFPLGAVGEPPSPDMPEGVIPIYEEARRVAVLSRRSAAALLRLALQMLVDEVAPGPGDINTKIGRLVQQGLHPQVQKAMDVLRVVGNNAVHPGTIDLEDDPLLVPGLFRLVTIVVDQMISIPKHAEALFANLPQQARDQVARRDGAASLQA